MGVKSVVGFNEKSHKSNWADTRIYKSCDVVPIVLNRERAGLSMEIMRCTVYRLLVFMIIVRAEYESV